MLGRLSLSRLNHGLPGVQTDPEMVQGTTDFHHEIAGALLPQADPVLHDAAALDTAVDMLDPRSRRWWSAWFARWCSRGSAWPRGFLVGMRITTSGRVKARNPRSGKSRLPAGKGAGVVSAMGFSWVRPPYVSLRKRRRSTALTSRTFLTVWSFFLPL